MSRERQTVVFAVSLAVMLGLAGLLQLARDRTYAFEAANDQVLYIRSGRMMQRAALSFDSLAADVYWIRALQYYGRERLKPAEVRRYDLLYPLLDLATTLDPRFTVGYRFGAIFLAEPHPGGAGRPDQAIALLKKGVTANPMEWDYYHDIGFIYYWNLHDYVSAAEWFGKGAELPGAPWWLKSYAAVMLTRGGDRQSSRAMWQQLSQTEENNWLRQTAELRLMQLDALDHIDALTKLVGEFTRRTGRQPESWEHLVAARMLAGIPLDPTGTPYVLGPDLVRPGGSTREVMVAESSRLYPLPTEPAAAPELRR